jgi:hypothetical protein
MSGKSEQQLSMLKVLDVVQHARLWLQTCTFPYYQPIIILRCELILSLGKTSQARFTVEERIFEKIGYIRDALRIN